MINPFKLKENKRYTLYGRTIIIFKILPYNVLWYYLDKWWINQIKKPNLHNSKLWWFLINVKKYKYC